MNFSRLLRNSQIGDFIRHRYFMIGLGLQKGMPLLIIPASIPIIGAGAYTQYVLIFTLVQIFGVLGSLSLAQAVFPFWYEHDSKEALVGSLLLIMAAVEVGFFAVTCVGLYFFWPYIHLDVSRTQGLLLIIPYAVIYSVNALALNILRLRLRQLAFLLSTAVTSATLLALILSLRYVRGSRLLWFTAANIIVMLVQTAFYMFNADVWPYRLLPSRQLKTFLRAVFRYSWPLTLYTLLTLSISSVDKWIVRAVFSPAEFSRYVFDIQFSFSLSFLSVIIGMYNSQKLCELVYKGDRAGLRNNLLGNYGITCLGSLAMGIVIYSYARLGGIHLTYGFWVLALAFTLCNCYVINSGLLSAQKRSRRMVLIGVLSIGVFAAILSMLFVWKSLVVIYLAYLGCYSTMLASSYKSVWADLRGDLSAEMAALEGTVAKAQSS